MNNIWVLTQKLWEMLYTIARLLMRTIVLICNRVWRGRIIFPKKEPLVTTDQNPQVEENLVEISRKKIAGQPQIAG